MSETSKSFMALTVPAKLHGAEKSDMQTCSDNGCGYETTLLRHSA